jgi:AraC-like DNA-binding protein/quercetin dioxygenase-like cupin family protein
MDNSVRQASRPFYFEPMLEQPKALDRLDIRFQWGNYGVRVLRCHLTTFAPGFIVDFHHHSEHEFHYIPRGKGKVILEGQTFPLQEGMLYLTGPGVTHSQEADALEAMDELCLHIEITKLEAPLAEGESSWGESWEVAEAEEAIQQLDQLPAVPAMDSQEAMKWFLIAYEAWRDNRLGLYTIIKQSVIQMLLRTIGAYNAVQPLFDLPSRDMKNYRYQLAVQFIHANFRRSLTLDTVAERVEISPRQLQRIFREQAGVTFSEYIESIRLANVCEELRHSPLTLERIAEKNGFTTSNYLHYVFKKAYGMTPNQYKESMGIHSHT